MYLVANVNLVFLFGRNKAICHLLHKVSHGVHLVAHAEIVSYVQNLLHDIPVPRHNHQFGHVVETLLHLPNGILGFCNNQRLISQATDGDGICRFRNFRERAVVHGVAHHIAVEIKNRCHRNGNAVRGVYHTLLRVCRHGEQQTDNYYKVSFHPDDFYVSFKLRANLP